MNSPKSVRRIESHSPPILPKKPVLPILRDAMTAASLASSSFDCGVDSNRVRVNVHSARTSLESVNESARYRLVVPSTRRVTNCASKSGLICRLAVDCGICSARAISPTANSCASSARKTRRRAGSLNIASSAAHSFVDITLESDRNEFVDAPRARESRGIRLNFHLVKYPAAMQSMHRAGHLAFEALESRGDRLRIFRMPDGGDASLLPCFQG